MNGAHKKDGEMFNQAYSGRTGRKKKFIMRLGRHWNRLCREVIDASLLEVFKVRLDRALSNLM